MGNYAISVLMFSVFIIVYFLHVSVCFCCCRLTFVLYSVKVGYLITLWVNYMDISCGLRIFHIYIGF